MQLSEAVATLAGQKELVAKLEHDLSTIQALSAVHRPDAEVPQHSGLALRAGGVGSAHLLFFPSFLILSFLFFLSADAPSRDLRCARAMGRCWRGRGFQWMQEPSSPFPSLGFEAEHLSSWVCPFPCTVPAQQHPGGVALPWPLWVGGKCLTLCACAAQGAATPSLEKIPEPIKEATALFYGEEGARLGWDTPGWAPLQGWQ